MHDPDCAVLEIDQPTMNAGPAEIEPALHLRALEAELLAMPPVAAMDLRVVDFDGLRLRLRAPLAANVNDKGCAFGGSLGSVMTLAGWGLTSLRLRHAGIAADVYVAKSDIRYRAPLYTDLDAEAQPQDGECWTRFFTTLRRRGRARIGISAAVVLPDGGIACDSRANFVAIARTASKGGVGTDSDGCAGGDTGDG
jgi:thioesterase domain-containing protein